MLIDTHSHLNFKDFDKDRDEVIKRSLESDVFLINIGSDYESSAKAVEIAKQHQKGIWAAVGLHPGDNKKEIFDYEKYKKLAQSKKVVAIGEIGLDYWNEPKGREKAGIFKEKQKEVFLKQLELANELNLPVILHCRKAHQDLIKILKLQTINYKLQAVVHCFTGNWQEAQKYIESGFYLGFNGIIFKFDVEETIKKMPLEKMLLETDCPFFCPPSARRSPDIGRDEGGQQDRNEPLNVKYIAQRLAEIRGEPLKKIAEITTQNAKKLFNLN